MSEPIYLVLPKSRRLVADMPPDEQPVNRLTAAGPAALSGAELIALILQTPDALDLAQDIINTAGGLHQLARCTAAELAAGYDLDATQAARIVAASEFGLRALTPPAEERYHIKGVDDAAAFLVPSMSLLEKEELRVLVLDGRHRVTSMITAYVGNVGQLAFRPAEIFRPAIQQGATAIILAHNHPSGRPEPSGEDLTTTKQLYDLGRELGIDVLDHLVIGHGSYTSIREWSANQGGDQ